LEIVSASKSLSGTFFGVTTAAQSLPHTAMAVCPLDLTALKAYSTWYRRPSGEKIVMWRS
jgi:hypothetical protein